MTKHALLLGCRCRTCRGRRATIWRALSDSQRCAMVLLDFAVPVHETYSRRRLVHANTTTSLIEADLVRRIFLYEEPVRFGMPFLVLTQRGEEVRRDGPRFEPIPLQSTTLERVS